MKLTRAHKMPPFSDETRIKRDLEALNNNLLRHLQCPICGTICRPPIYSCPRGHTTCKKCKSSITECPRCHSSKSTTRNRLAEELFTKALTPCRYSRDGCKKRFNVEDHTTHFGNCNYRYKCRVYVRDLSGHTTRCQWHGSRHDMVSHVKKVHPSNYDQQALGAAVRVTNITASSHQYALLVDVDGEFFWWIVNFDGVATGIAAAAAELKMYAKHVGPGKSGTSYRYRCQMELVASDARHRFKFCTQVMKLHEVVIGGCKNVQLNMIDLFVDNNGVFECTVKIFAVS